MIRKPQIYLAGPYGFSEAGSEFHNKRLIPAIEAVGCAILDPWKLAPLKQIKEIQDLPYGLEKRDAWHRVNMEIGENNERLIKKSDGVIAVLDGIDVDSGTAAEIGFAYGVKKLILGYRGDSRLCSENEGGIVNIQVEYFIRQSGGTISKSLEELQKEVEIRFVKEKKGVNPQGCK